MTTEQIKVLERILQRAIKTNLILKKLYKEGMRISSGKA